MLLMNIWTKLSFFVVNENSIFLLKIDQIRLVTYLNNLSSINLFTRWNFLLRRIYSKRLHFIFARPTLCLFSRCRFCLLLKITPGLRLFDFDVALGFEMDGLLALGTLSGTLFRYVFLSLMLCSEHTMIF